MKKYSRHWKKNKPTHATKISLLALWLLCGFNVTYGQNTGHFDEETLLPVDTSIITGVLPNGLKYFIKQHNEPQNRAEFRLAVKAGSLQEEDDQLGVAHFVEHMAFNGTRHFEKNTLIDFIERNGSRFGADLNAFTSFDQTVYMLQVQTDSVALLDTALQVLADWASEVRFDSLEVAKERGIIRSEWRSGLSSRQRLEEQSYSVSFQGSRYAVRKPIGSPELIDTVSHQRLIDYYRRWYQPANMAVIAVGNFDPKQLEKGLKAYFSSLTNKDFVPPQEYPLNQQARQAYLLATDEEAAYTQWSLTYQLDTLSSDHNLGQLRNQLLHSLYSSILNKRFAILREQETPPFIFASSYFQSILGKNNGYRVSAMAKVEDFTLSLERIMLENRRAALHGFLEEELSTQKEAIQKRFERLAKESDNYSSESLANDIRSAFIEEHNIVDKKALPEYVAECLQSIHLEDLHRLAKSWSTAPIRMAIIKTNSDLIAQIPDSTRFFEIVDSVLQVDISAWQPIEQQGSLLSLPTASGTAELIHYDSTLSISTYELSNGIRLYLKPTDFKIGDIKMRAISSGGKSLIEDDDYPTANYVIALQTQSGIDTFKQSELSQLLSGQYANLRPYLGEYEEGISGGSPPEDLATLFQLLYLQFMRPRFDSLVLVNLLDRQRSILEQVDTDPRSAFGRMMIDRKYNDHPRRPNLSLEELTMVNLERSKIIYQERFANPADFDFLFVGDFSVDSLLNLAAQYLAVLPTETDKKEHWQDRGIRLNPNPIDTVVVAGQTPKAEVSLSWHGPFPYANPDARLHFMGLRQLLNIKLREELREKMSGVYGVRINSNYRSIPDSLFTTTISFNAEPGMVDSLIAHIYGVLAEIATGAIKESDLEKIKATQLKSYEEALRNNAFWLGQMSNVIQNNYPLEKIYPDVYPKRLQTLTAKGIAQTAREQLLKGTHFKFVLLPEQ